MSLTGTPEVAITDGTIVPVKGANENGWNRLGGYTVMLKAAFEAGPIEKGDLFILRPHGRRERLESRHEGSSRPADRRRR